mgnify:CR=1 FL=1
MSMVAHRSVLAAPTVLHHEIAREILEAGIHCLVEKPITSTVAQAGELVELAEARGLALAVGHVERYNPADAYVIAVGHLSDRAHRVVNLAVSLFRPQCPTQQLTLTRCKSGQVPGDFEHLLLEQDHP